MITPRAQVKLLDFGLAKRFSPPGDQSSNTTTQLQSEPGMIVGTVEYMSPEQALGREVDHRSDIFSLGVVLYEAATGSLPFRAANPIETINRIVNTEPQPVTELNPQVTTALARVISKCLAKQVQDRYQSAWDVSIDLNRDEARIPVHFRGRNNLPKQLTTVDANRKLQTSGLRFRAIVY